MTPHKETHPMIKKMMGPYYKQHKKISGNMICRAAGTHVGELKLQGACLHHILAGCVGSWGRRHPESSSAAHKQVKFICDKLRPGISVLTKDEGQGQKQRYERGGRYQRS